MTKKRFRGQSGREARHSIKGYLQRTKDRAGSAPRRGEEAEREPAESRGEGLEREGPRARSSGGASTVEPDVVTRVPYPEASGERQETSRDPGGDGRLQPLPETRRESQRKMNGAQPSGEKQSKSPPGDPGKLGNPGHKAGKGKGKDIARSKGAEARANSQPAEMAKGHGKGNKPRGEEGKKTSKKSFQRVRA